MAQAPSFVHWPIATVGELIEHLGRFAIDTPIALTDSVRDVSSRIIGLATEHLPKPTGTLMLVGELFVEIGEPYDEGE